MLLRRSTYYFLDHYSVLQVVLQTLSSNRIIQLNLDLRNLTGKYTFILKIQFYQKTNKQKKPDRVTNPAKNIKNESGWVSACSIPVIFCEPVEGWLLKALILGG